MELTAFEWVLIGGAASLAIGVIAFFLKRTMSRVDKHDEDIGHIKLTYVTKSDHKELRNELRDEIEKLTDGIGDIRTNYLTTRDFYRNMSETKAQLDKIYQILLSERGGGAGGQE